MNKISLISAAKQALIAILILLVVGIAFGFAIDIAVLLDAAGHPYWAWADLLGFLFVLLTAGVYFHDR